MIIEKGEECFDVLPPFHFSGFSYTKEKLFFYDIIYIFYVFDSSPIKYVEKSSENRDPTITLDNGDNNTIFSKKAWKRHIMLLIFIFMETIKRITKKDSYPTKVEK